MGDIGRQLKALGEELLDTWDPSWPVFQHRLETLRSAIKKLLNYSGMLPQSPLRADIFDAIIRAGHDPDDCLATWLVEGHICRRVRL